MNQPVVGIQRIMICPRLEERFATGSTVIGQSILNLQVFLGHARKATFTAIEGSPNASQIKGIALPSTVLPYVSCGIGPRSSTPGDHLVLETSYGCEVFLNRLNASTPRSVVIDVMTRDRYFHEGHTAPEGVTHVIWQVYISHEPTWKEPPRTANELVEAIENGTIATGFSKEAQRSRAFWKKYERVANK